MKLVVVKGEKTGKEFELHEGTNLIGRWDPTSGSFPEIDLEEVDEEARVSRRHALLTLRPESITIEDLGSLNGTVLGDGTRAVQDQKYSVNVGDVLVFGAVALKLEN